MYVQYTGDQLRGHRTDLLSLVVGIKTMAKKRLKKKKKNWEMSCRQKLAFKIWGER